MSDLTYRSFTGTGAENYEKFFVPAIGLPVSAGLLDAADLREGERVLDVACGTGLIARLAAEQVGASGSVTGIDVAPDMIDVARTISPEGTQIDWHVGDAASLPLPDESYDVVFCQMGLMFMEDRGSALAEMRRVLAQGGRIVVNTPGQIQPPFEIMEQAIVSHINAELGGFVRAVFSMPDPAAVAGLLTEAGLNEVTSEVSTTTLRLPSPADFLWQYINLTPMGPFVAQASAADRAEMEQQIVELWEPYVLDGATLVEQPMVTASGRR